ncbi:MAG: GGDEF domain-containing protein [Pseudobutyrivibrio sp.]|nr:GGDEF domain-containing protein [Pseudobutyrivibrio sp.]
MDINIYSADIKKIVLDIVENRGKKPNRVLEMCAELEKIGREKSDDALVGYACFSRGETYYLLNDATNFYSSMLSCLAPMERIKEWGYVAIANNMLGIMSLNRGNAPFALDYYIKSISICQEFCLPDIEWMVHMNLGALYLNIEEHQKCLDHTLVSYSYIISHPNMDGQKESLTTAYILMAKAYLRLDKENKVIDIAQKLREECLPYLSAIEKVVVFCFFAILHNSLGEPDVRDKWIYLVNEGTSYEMPIMDVFDDFYDYLEMLLSIEKYDDFFKVYSLLDDYTKKTTIKNLEKKLLTLKIRYFRRTAQIEEYKISSVLFFELSEFMERENKLMVNNMIIMRNSYNELTEINKKVEKENNDLHKKSETDPLTGLSNRYKLNEYTDSLFEKSIKNQTPLAVEILDIDYFKQYNDNYGHQAGDECIRFIGQKLSDMSKDPKVFCARYGGDEFVIIYEGYSKEDTLEKAKGLRSSIVDAAFEHKFSLAADIVTISQGICWGIPQAGQGSYTFLHNADNQLYEVKKESRNSIKIGTVDKEGE